MSGGSAGVEKRIVVKSITNNKNLGYTCEV
jgi:hypothetical protein